MQLNHQLKEVKRLRSILALDIAAQISMKLGKLIDATELALALEYLYASSLIIDDMPHFDNDYIRRGNPSIHSVYGMPTAQMASTVLTSMAMECLIRQVNNIQKQANNLQESIKAIGISPKLFLIISEKLGIKGASGGQLTEYSTDNVDLDVIEDIIKKRLHLF